MYPWHCLAARDSKHAVAGCQMLQRRALHLLPPRQRGGAGRGLEVHVLWFLCVHEGAAQQMVRPLLYHRCSLTDVATWLYALACLSCSWNLCARTSVPGGASGGYMVAQFA